MNNTFLDSIVSAFKASCLAFKAAHPDQDVYLVGLFTSGEYLYLYPTFSTQQGLEEVALKYLQDPYYKDKYATLAAMMQDLKWSPCDSPYHLAHEEHFEAINEELEEFWDDIGDISSAAFMTRCKHIHSTCMQAIKIVKEAGIFDQQQVLFHFLMGDQSDEARYLNARELNHGPVLENYVSSLEVDQESLQNLIETRWDPFD